jgi:hypothetical protein
MGYRTIALSSGSAKEALAKELGAHEYLDSTKVNQAEELQKFGGAKVILGQYSFDPSKDINLLILYGDQLSRLVERLFPVSFPDSLLEVNSLFLPCLMTSPCPSVCLHN